MNIGIYSPYLDTLGGGERYMLTIAESLSKKNQVELLIDTHLQTLKIKEIIDKASKLLDLDLSEVKIINAPLGRGSSAFDRFMFLRRYDVLFCLTDGSIFYSSAKKSILHIQSPVKIESGSFLRQIKQSSWNSIIYNSQFTKNECEKYWNIRGEVVFPPVNIKMFKSGLKKKQIVSVGRFFGYLKEKKHELMIDSFKKIIDSKKGEGWSLHLAGGAQDGDLSYIEELKKIACGYPVYIHPNLPLEDLKKLYSESVVYWHATGFGETDPSKLEHFGITTVEAMASGCIPVVVNLGGQKEIVENGINGFLWNTPQEMIETTIKIIKDVKANHKISQNAQSSVEKFSKDEFIKKINSLT